MDGEMIAQIRSFNRTVTQRIGALYDEFLARDRPLGQARVLWEVGPNGCDVRLLRLRLDLDSGYLSRILRALEHDGLVELERSGADGRVRVLRLTAVGSAEVAELDRRSDRAALAILDPLTEEQRARLAGAMAEVQRLLIASMVSIGPADPRSPEARSCLRAYFGELSRRFPGGFDPALSIGAADQELTPPAGLFLIAMLQGEPAGCGAVKYHDSDPAEIKRMWVNETVRGLGLGRRILAELEARAASNGARLLRLETNDTLAEAIGLYRSAGYREVPAFNDEPYAHHWFEKALS
jgi:DNA-binding MarR family transcriptional regulator/GNAT superfamily N-acetyltransferase